MELILFDGFTKDINSTARPVDSTGRVVNVYLKENTSILQPTFMIDGIVLNCNYCKWNSRYYFINDIKVGNNNIYELNCTVDVLATWRPNILNSTQYVLRSASNYDGNIVDSYYPTKAINHYNDHTFTTLRPEPTQIFNGVSAVVGIIGKSVSTTSGITYGAVNYYAMSLSTCNALISSLMDNTDYFQITGIEEGLQKALVNPISYITSVTLVPLNPLSFNDGTPVFNVNVGWWNVSVGTGICYAIDPLKARKTTINHTFTLPLHPDADSRHAKYLSYSEYSKHTLYIEPYGMIPIDSTKLSVDTTAEYTPELTITEIVDCITGEAILTVKSHSLLGDKNIAYGVAKLGVSVQLAQMAVDRLNQQKIAINTAAAGASGILSTASGLISGNILGAGSSAINTIANVSTGIIDAERASYPQLEKSGSQGSIASWYIQPHLFSKFNILVDDDNTHLGRPLCQDIKLSNLSGFTLCRDSEISVPGLKEESEMIKQYMNTGFYIV